VREKPNSFEIFRTEVQDEGNLPPLKLQANFISDEFITESIELFFIIVNTVTHLGGVEDI